MNCEEWLNIREYIKTNEGLKLKPYKCTANKTTIGWGRNLDDKGISENEAELMLTEDINDCLDSLCSIFNYLGLRLLSEKRQLVLIDMMFNLGKIRFLKFKKMIQAVKDGDWEEAAAQILNSRYARQLPNRSKCNADMMRGS